MAYYPTVFTGRTTIKSLLGISSDITQYDTAIDIVAQMTDDIILDEIGLTSATVQTYNEKFDVLDQGTNELALSYTPVQTIAAVTILTALDGTQGTALATTEYYFTEWGAFRLKPLYALLPTGRQVISICYTAGFSSVPNDLKYAASLIAVQAFNQQSHLGYKSEKAGDYSYTMNAGGCTIPALARRILNKHRRLFVTNP